MPMIHLLYRVVNGEDLPSMELISPGYELIDTIRLIQYSLVSTPAGGVVPGYAAAAPVIHPFYTPGIFVHTDWLRTGIHNKKITGSNNIYLPIRINENTTIEPLDVALEVSTDLIPSSIGFRVYDSQSKLLSLSTRNYELQLWLEYTVKDV